LILSAALTDAAAGVTKLTAYATLNAAPADAAVGVTKLTSYVVIPNIDIRDGFDPLFPPNLSFGATGGCGWKTNVVVTSSGEEYRSAGWSLSLGRWIVSHKLRTAQQMTELASLFRSCQGQKGVFRFKDWTDFTVGSGEGVIVLFEGMDVLAKKYTILDVFGTTYVALRPIFRPSRYSVVFNEPNIGLNYSNGVVYNANRLTTTWTGEFEVPARFASDLSDIAFKTPTGLGWDNIVIQEDRISLAGV
jgi:uncharacterized protein (TIGR02217 family)